MKDLLDEYDKASVLNLKIFQVMKKASSADASIESERMFSLNDLISRSS
jgi:hypothetical protein